jgi:hypothetical protein
VELLIAIVGNDYPISEVEAALSSDNYDVDMVLFFTTPATVTATLPLG